MTTTLLTGAAAVTVLLARHPHLADSPEDWTIRPDGTVYLYLNDKHGQAGVDYLSALAKALRMKPRIAEFTKGYGDQADNLVRVHQIEGRAGGTTWDVSAYLDLGPAAEDGDR